MRFATVPVVWTASGENKLRLVAGCWFHDSPKSNLSCLAAECCEACGQPPTCGQGGGNAQRFPRLVHRGPRLRGQAGIGAADCPQIHSTCSAWRQSAAERGATLIKELLTFARRQPLRPKAVDVSAVVDDAEKILKQTISPDIRLLILSEPGLRPAWVDPNQLGLAILNLALNARDAMPNGGSLQIACENRRVEAGGQ